MSVPPQGPPPGWPPQGPPGWPPPGPAEDCPYISFFDRESPKIFGQPDKAAVEAKLTEFVGE